MKRCLIVFLMLVLAIFSGCTDTEDGTWQADTDELHIYNLNNEIIGKFETSGGIRHIDGGFVYKQTYLSESGRLKEEFYRYEFSTSESTYLGTINDVQYAAQDFVYLDNCVYLLEFIGDITESSYPTLEVWKIDLSSNSMMRIIKEKNVSPHSLMVAENNKLLMYWVKRDGSELVEYNITDKKQKILKRFVFDNAAGKGMAIRKMTVDETTISFLVIDCRSEEDFDLRVDVYDHDMNFIRMIDMQKISEINTEKRQTVRKLQVMGDYIYYENNSSTKFLGKIQDGSATANNTTKEKLTKAFEHSTENNHLFYKLNEKGELNLYLFDSLSGNFKFNALECCGEGNSIASVFRDNEDNLIISVSSQNQTTRKWTDKLYYTNLSKLVFE